MTDQPRCFGDSRRVCSYLSDSPTCTCAGLLMEVYTLGKVDTVTKISRDEAE
jgi:hypothetical protein